MVNIRGEFLRIVAKAQLDTAQLGLSPGLVQPVGTSGGGIVAPHPIIEACIESGNRPRRRTIRYIDYVASSHIRAGSASPFGLVAERGACTRHRHHDCVLHSRQTRRRAVRSDMRFGGHCYRTRLVSLPAQSVGVGT